MRAMGAAVSRARSRCEDVDGGDLGELSMRAAAASAWRRPSSVRCRPGAWPGSLIPVVGVSPWRTSRTTVAASAIGRAG